MLSSRVVQQCFCDHLLPAIVLGSAFPGLPLTSIDSDYRSVGHHSAGLFLGKAHRQIVWMVPEAGHAGDMETEESLLKGLRQGNANETSCRIIRHGASGSDLIQKISQLFASPAPSTAFFVISPFATTALVTHLLSRGLRIPQDVSVITRDYDPLLEWIRPPSAHYIPPLRRIASRISRLAVEMATSSPFPLYHIQIMPQFCCSESLTVCPEIKGSNR